jgi:hypothetical protein
VRTTGELSSNAASHIVQEIICARPICSLAAFRFGVKGSYYEDRESGNSRSMGRRTALMAGPDASEYQRRAASVVAVLGSE